MSEDPNLRLAIARRAYAAAITRRDALAPGDPGYHDAVLDVGLRWSQIRYWERRITPSPSPAVPSAAVAVPSAAVPSAAVPSATDP